MEDLASEPLPRFEQLVRSAFLRKEVRSAKWVRRSCE
jgi:hypothetical protein